jgi:hypothetical protein
MCGKNPNFGNRAGSRLSAEHSTAYPGRCFFSGLVDFDASASSSE